MKVSQIYQIVNNMAKEILGKEDVLTEDLSNVVDIGKEMLNSTDIENYTKKLVDHIGRVIFVDRVYRGSVPSVLMDAWEFGSVLEKIQADTPEATENKSWELENGVVYEQDTFYKPSVSAKFFNERVTFEVPMSFTEMQVKSAFSSLDQLNGFLSMLYNAVDRALTIRLDALIMRTINNMTAQTFHADIPGGTYGASSTNKCVNLLKLYNATAATQLTAENCIKNPDFIKFASYTMGLYADRLGKISTLFNVGGKERFTPREDLHWVMLTDFKLAADVYLQSDTFHNEFTALPNAETVPYWQGSGKDYGFGSTSEIHVNIKDGETTAEVVATGILGVMFDRNALGVTNLDKRTTSHYNARAEFFNNWYKADAGYYNDLNENFVVFYVADAA